MSPLVWTPARTRLFAWALSLAGLAALPGCGGGDNALLYIAPPKANPAVTRLLSSVDAIGVGGAGLLSSNPELANLELQAHRAGATVQLRFSCSGCSLTVRAGAATAGANQYLSIPFASLEPASDAAVTVTDNASGQVAEYTLRARPLDHAPYAVSVNNNPEPGELYLSPFDPDGRGPAYAYVIGSDGTLQYYYRNPPGQEIHDFKKTVIAGGQVRYSFYDAAAAAIRVMDAGFTTLDLVQARPFPDGNTYAIDGHDHSVLGDGHYLVGVRAAKTVSNIPALPGQALFVTGTGLQEIDGGAAVFSWLSTDHPALYACSARGNAYSANRGADYMRWTALQVDGDGHWLASFAHLDAVLKIDRGSGAVAWVLGGACDQFGLTEAQKFAWPHDARRAPDGRLTLFDIAPEGTLARVRAFALDEAGRTLTSQASLTQHGHWSYDLGSAQLFASGRVLVGWGAFEGCAADVSEFDANTGALSFELTLLPGPRTWGYFSYRARKAL